MAAHLREEAELERDRAPIATVGGLAFDGGGRCLLIRTAKWSGLWGTPGGKLRYREPMAAGFAREVREETGLEVVDVRFALAQDSIDHPQFFRPRHFVLLNFVGRVAGGEVRLNYEADECAWVSLREARQLELNEPTRVLVEHVAAHPELLAWEGGWEGR
jgi:ADP-ribose pyrophosphatase YjhB (NUDIX family)